MNRALKNRTRGNQRADIPDVPVTGQPQQLAVYNGRANTEAGGYSQRVVKPLQPDGMLSNWMGNTPPN